MIHLGLMYVNLRKHLRHPFWKDFALWCNFQLGTPSCGVVKCHYLSFLFLTTQSWKLLLTLLLAPQCVHLKSFIQTILPVLLATIKNKSEYINQFFREIEPVGHTRIPILVIILTIVSLSGEVHQLADMTSWRGWLASSQSRQDLHVTVLRQNSFFGKPQFLLLRALIDLGRHFWE